MMLFIIGSFGVMMIFLLFGIFIGFAWGFERGRASCQSLCPDVSAVLVQEQSPDERT